MDEQIEKLISHAGGSGRYQIIILIVAFFVWSSLSLHNTSIPMLETVPLVKTNTTEETKLTYEICDKGQYNITEKYGFSWITEMEIECSKTKVGMIGLFIYSGLAVGSLVFSIINKYLSYRHLIITFTIVYVFFLFLTTIIANFYFRLFCLFCLGICNCLANMSTMTLVSESVSSKKRSLFTGVINSGYSFCPIVYTPLYVILGQWRYIFWIENIVAIACAIVYFFILENSPRMNFSKNKINDAVESLRRIAAFNKKLEEFDDIIKDKEFDSLLRNEKEGVEKDIKIEMKQTLGYSALFKYKSVLYKFLIFTFLFMSTTFLTNAVVINTKKMEGNTYIIIVSLYFVEVIANACCGFIINLGRKLSLIGFYLGITLGFVLTFIFSKSAIGGWAAMVLIRFCITGVYTTFYIYLMETYPTPVRSLGFGLNSTFGNIAGLISPVIIEYINKYVLYVIFAIISGINIFLTLFLKETVGKPLIETIEELVVPEVEKEKLIPGRESDVNNLNIGIKEGNNEKDKLEEPLLNNEEENMDGENKEEEKKKEEIEKTDEKKLDEKIGEGKKEEENKEEKKKKQEKNKQEKKDNDKIDKEYKEEVEKDEEKKDEENKYKRKEEENKDGEKEDEEKKE